MTTVRETQLPGVGVRFDFVTEDGEQVGVVVHTSGRREIVRYRDDDPDACSVIAHLSEDDSRTLAEILGATSIAEAMEATQQRVEGLALDWIEVAAGAPVAGLTIAASELRSRTGASIVATVGAGGSNPAPAPEDVISVGDTVVVVGTPEGIETARSLLRS